MKNILFLLLCFVSGCRYVYTPGDLIIVRLPDAIETWHEGLGGKAVRSGIRYWDVVGAKYRTEDQALREFGIDAINRSENMFFFLLDDPSRAGEYEWSGSIGVNLNTWGAESPIMEMVVAHEIGHSMGLCHISDTESIMSGQVSSVARIDVSLFDLQEFERVWGRN